MGPGRKEHGKKHPVDSIRDHKPVPGGVEDNIVSIDANGLPTKDTGIKVTDLTGGLIPQGLWAASTNTPTLVNGVGTIGYFYIASDAGTVDFGAGPITFAQNDYVIYVTGNIWIKQDKTQDIHAIGGALHSASTIAELNSKISDTDLLSLSDIAEPKQAIGYYVSDVRGTTEALGADGSDKNSYNTINEAIAKGVLNGDDTIIINLDTRNTFGYDADIPAGEKVVINGSEPLASISGYLNNVTLGDGCTLSLDNLSVVSIKEGSPYTGGTLYIEECYLFNITDNAGTGNATLTDGIFVNSFVDTTSVIDQIKAMNSYHGKLINLKIGAERIFMLDAIDMDGEKIRNLQNASADQDAMAYGQRFPLSEGAIHEAESTTTNTSFQQKLRLTTSDLPLGDYHIEWYFEIKSSNGGSDDVLTQVDMNEGTILSEPTNGAGVVTVTPLQTKSNYQGEGGFKRVFGISGVQTIDIDYKATNGTAYIRRARVAIRRIG